MTKFSEIRLDPEMLSRITGSHPEGRYPNVSSKVEFSGFGRHKPDTRLYKNDWLVIEFFIRQGGVSGWIPVDLVKQNMIMFTKQVGMARNTAWMLSNGLKEGWLQGR
jgi:hypothetical protein